jgi:hypothetical protein
LCFVALVEWIRRQESQPASEALEPEYALADAGKVVTGLFRQVIGRSDDVQPEQYRHHEVAEIMAESGRECPQRRHPLEALELAFLSRQFV